MVGLCMYLDRIGCYRAADEAFERYAQFIQPSNNQNVPIGDRMIPWSELESTFKERDWQITKGDPRKRLLDYVRLPGNDDPEASPSDGGTSNLNAGRSEYKKVKLINLLKRVYKQTSNHVEKRKILDQIGKLRQGDASAEALVGNAFDQHGPDDVPGPRNIIIDHSSPSMVGLDGFEWDQRRHTGLDAYKNLLPL